jgi:flagellar M-ring protein FliF
VFGVTSTVLLIVVSMVATRPHMVVLFSGVKPEDAGAIVAKLQETKVPYEVDGTTIKVPEKSVYETRIQLASAGLPQSGTVGFEIFDKTSLMGMTEFSQRVSYQRAIQGELTRTINQIENIVDSKVIIAIPEESVYSQNDKKPTASVTVKLKPGNTLDSDKVAGIVHLVSSAVEGLEASRVTVVDMNGNMLSEATDDPTGIDPRMSSTQLKLKREYERVVEQDIQSMLERVLGPSKAIVRANAKINFDRKEENR